ncbi:hypothetical protein [Peribacillus simplex]|uniref:hypothetical protein n=1 Tax=Peribacillus simplex TaxID=1478 RepID=UPI0024BF80D8|nr:hypothetical protein [Peribacillus simplex]WHY96084.1 hypothetical protein QNH37_19125 [Peribacillus simplex]
MASKLSVQFKHRLVGCFFIFNSREQPHPLLTEVIGIETEPLDRQYDGSIICDQKIGKFIALLENQNLEGFASTVLVH